MYFADMELEEKCAESGPQIYVEPLHTDDVVRTAKLICMS